MENQLESILKECTVISEYLKNNSNPYTKVVISQEGVKLTTELECLHIK